MVYKITMLSDEVDNFVRIFHVDSEATFFDLHDAILNSVNYEKNQITSFFICSDNWEKGQEVTLMEMESSSEYDNLVMSETKLEELLVDENQKLIYVFDLMSERVFFMELTEIIPGKDLSEVKCVSAEGDAPIQIMEDDLQFLTAASTTAPKEILADTFYGDEDYDQDELDDEGFGEMNFDDASLFTDDSKF